ncbi:hypothetical protein MNBD_GAMMA23-2334 [hydrothermal vent metagenome]|uniref:Peptidase M48 domain-containing protein n=1 Tax=hydrothermal vent metagenome TaxID=652676 RepID=A0A3B0ZSF9_9ZZZZ
MNQRYHFRLLAMLKSYFLVVLIPLVMLFQLYFISQFFHFNVISNFLFNSFFYFYSQPNLLVLYLLIGFSLCCAIWCVSRLFVLCLLLLKNRRYFPNFSAWFVTSTPKQAKRFPVSSNQYYWIYRLASKMARKLNIATPAIAVDGSLNVNAKVLPDFMQPSLIVLTQGLLNKLTPDEVEAVVAHELAHVAMRDTLSMSILDLLILLSVWFPIYSLHLLIDHVFLYKWRDKNIGFIFSSVLVLLCYGVLPLFILNTINRRCELRADKIAMTCVNRQSFVSALKAVHASQSQIPGTLDWCLLSMPKPVQKFVLRMFLTHPPIPSRIEAAQQA